MPKIRLDLTYLPLASGSIVLDIPEGTDPDDLDLDTIAKAANQLKRSELDISWKRCFDGFEVVEDEDVTDEADFQLTEDGKIINLKPDES